LLEEEDDEGRGQKAVGRLGNVTKLLQRQRKDSAMVCAGFCQLNCAHFSRSPRSQRSTDITQEFF